MISVGHVLPKKGGSILISSGDATQKADMLDACRRLHKAGYGIYATMGTWKFLVENEIPAQRVLWPSEVENNPENNIPSALELIRKHQVDLVINIPRDFTHTELTNGYKMRRTSIDFNVPLITNSRLATAYIRAFTVIGLEDLAIKSWDEYK